MPHCPDEIFGVVTQILHLGLVSLRQVTWTGGGVNLIGYIRAETDHLHNLPDLLNDFLPRKLDYYLDAEVPSYEEVVAQVADATSNVRETLTKYRPLWAQLRAWRDAQTQD